MRNMDLSQVTIFNVANKPLPFRQKEKADVIKNAGYKVIFAELQQPKKKCYVIDDSQYLLCFEMFAKAKETGYQKFTDAALHFYNTIKLVIEAPDDVIVYFLHHTEITDTGKTKAKTIGKMLDSQLTVEGLFSIVLLCKTENGRHWFETKSDGTTTAKSPMEMFDNEIDNDLNMVDKTIREYYNL